MKDDFIEKVEILQELGFQIKESSKHNDYEDLRRTVSRFSNFSYYGIIRALGLNHSNNTKTLWIEEEYLIANKISDIFNELHELTDKEFKYKVINEFGSEMDDSDFWAEIGVDINNSYFEFERKENYPVCEYILGSDSVKFEYKFTNAKWHTLNREAVEEILKQGKAYFKNLNLNCIYPFDEEIIFFQIPKESNEKLSQLLDQLYLIEKNISKTNLLKNRQSIKTKEDIKLSVENRIDGRLEEMKLSEHEIKVLKTKTESAGYKIITFPVAFLVIIFVITLIPVKRYELLRGTNDSARYIYDIVGISNLIIATLVITALITFLLLMDSNYFKLKKDLVERKKILCTGIVSKSGCYHEEFYIKLQSGKPKLIRSYKRSLMNFRKGDEITFEVYKNSKVFLNWIPRN